MDNWWKWLSFVPYAPILRLQAQTTTTQHTAHVQKNGDEEEEEWQENCCWKTLSTFQTALVKYVECVLNGSAMQNVAKMHICRTLCIVIVLKVLLYPFSVKRRERVNACMRERDGEEGASKPEVHSLSFVSWRLKKNLLHLFLRPFRPNPKNKRRRTRSERACVCVVRKLTSWKTQFTVRHICEINFIAHKHTDIETVRHAMTKTCRNFMHRMNEVRYSQMNLEFLNAIQHFFFVDSPWKFSCVAAAAAAAVCFFVRFPFAPFLLSLYLTCTPFIYPSQFERIKPWIDAYIKRCTEQIKWATKKRMRTQFLSLLYSAM